jgi:hypothetical protein
VSVSAEHGQEPTKLEGWLDAVLDELATPQKRPFGGMQEAPSGTLAQAASSRKAVEPAPAEPGPPVRPTEAEQPEAEEPKAEPAPAPEPPRKKRFFGLL